MNLIIPLNCQKAFGMERDFCHLTIVERGQLWSQLWSHPLQLKKVDHWKGE
jgi:hypothetical protein